ncbi:hypothetical protein Q1695_007835 [Nippostrongylus brasiliensis]|nr:hypothetical protein Q1695_007835 [Nippostrongylus brasiliensis]
MTEARECEMGINGPGEKTRKWIPDCQRNEQCAILVDTICDPKDDCGIFNRTVTLGVTFFEAMEKLMLPKLQTEYEMHGAIRSRKE